jgi:hypothetical protein
MAAQLAVELAVQLGVQLTVQLGVELTAQLAAHLDFQQAAVAEVGRPAGGLELTCALLAREVLSQARDGARLEIPHCWALRQV